EVVDPAVRREHAGVADQHIEPSAALDRPLDDGLDLGQIGDVGEHRLDVAVDAVTLEIGDRRLQRRVGDVAEYDLGVRLGGQATGDGRTERAARAEDRDHPCRSRRAHTSWYPPSTWMTAPVMNADASEARNWNAPVRSADLPQRRIAVCWRIESASRSLLVNPSASGDSTQPGDTTLTVIPAGARSRARPLAMPISPAFDALYGVSPLRGRSPSTEPVKINRPPSPITRAAARAPRNAPVRLTSITSRHSSGSIASGPATMGEMPALQIHTSMPPHSATVPSATASLKSASRMSPLNVSVSPGSSSATAFRSRSVRATNATFAPARENAWAMTSPSPRPAPVITTRRPLTSPGWGNVSGISIRSAIGTFPSTFASIGPISTIHAVRAMIAVDGRTDPRRDQPHARHPEGHAALPRGRRRPAAAAVARLGSRREWLGELPGEPAGIRRALPHARARHAGLRQELLVRRQPGDVRAGRRRRLPRRSGARFDPDRRQLDGRQRRRPHRGEHPRPGDSAVDDRW